MHKKLDYIKRIVQKDEDGIIGRPSDLYIHSILSTINIKELINAYLTLPDTKIKKSIESNIEKRIENETSDILYSSLYNLVSTSNYSKRQRIRKLLFAMLRKLDKIYTEDFFNIFYYSPYRNDISAALQISNVIWDVNINRKVLDDYLSTKNQLYLETYIKNGDHKTLVTYIEEIWEFQIDYYLKLNIIRKLCPVYISKLEFLKSKEPDKYLFALTLSNIQVGDKILLDCFNQLNEKQKPYGILCLGKLKKWNLIEKEIITYIETIF
jgi:hypothetical protein